MIFLKLATMRKLFLLAIFFLIYAVISELSAKKKAETFCGSVRIGDPVSELRTRGIAAGARAKATNWAGSENSSRQLAITFTGYYPGSDYICLVTESSGVVIAKDGDIATSLLQ